MPSQNLFARHTKAADQAAETMKNRIVILSFLIIIGAVSIYGQGNRKMTLIVAECQKYVPDVWCEPQTNETVAYHFENGMLKNREVLMTNDLYPFAFHFPTTARYVYQNRYLISDGGDIYDYEKRKIIYRNNSGGILTRTENETIQNLGVVRIIGDLLIVRLAVSDAESTNREGFYAYNLRTDKFRKIRDIRDFPRLEARNFSPGDKMIAVIEQMKLVFYAVDEKFDFKKLRTINLGYALPTDIYEDKSEDVPIVWADNGNVLTQNKAGNIVRVLLNGKISLILKPKIIDDGGKPSEILKDRFGNFLVYPCNDRKTCLMNLQTRTLKEIDNEPLGNNFSAMPEKKMSNNEIWQYDFFYKDKLIGKNRAGSIALTDGEYLAVENKDRNKEIGSVRVWNAVSKDWAEIKLNWFNYNYIVGWIKGK